MTRSMLAGHTKYDFERDSGMPSATELLGRQEDLQFLLQTLEEEKRTDEFPTQIAERSVNQQAAS